MHGNLLLALDALQVDEVFDSFSIGLGDSTYAKAVAQDEQQIYLCKLWPKHLLVNLFDREKLPHLVHEFAALARQDLLLDLASHFFNAVHLEFHLFVLLVHDSQAPSWSQIPEIETIHLGSCFIQGDGALPQQVARKECDDEQELLVEYFSFVWPILLLLYLVFDLCIGDEAFYFCQSDDALAQFKPRHRQDKLHRVKVLILATTLEKLDKLHMINILADTTNLVVVH